MTLIQQLLLDLVGFTIEQMMIEGNQEPFALNHRLAVLSAQRALIPPRAYIADRDVWWCTSLTLRLLRSQSL